MAAQAQAIFAQVDEQSKNASAQQFDRLAATLGFIPNDPLSLSPYPDHPINAAAQEQYNTIQPTLNNVLSKQLGQVDNPLPALPPNLEAYLAATRPNLLVLQTHLLTQAPPRWEIDIVRMSEEGYPFPGLTNVFNTQKLLLLLALSHRENNQPTDMLSALEASWRLNQTTTQRPDLVSQISASTIADYQATLLRHTAGLSQPQLAKWQHRFAQQARQLSGIEGIRFETWLQ